MRHAQTPDTKTLPISVYQHRYWLKWAENPSSSSFNTSMVFEMSGPLDREALKQACHFITQKHDIMHATFSADGSAQYYTEFDIDDFMTERACATGVDIHTELSNILNEPFDLVVGPLVRICLLTHESTVYLIAIGHHIIADAATAKIITSDVALAYLAICRDPSSLEPQHYSYSACIDALHALQTPEKQHAAQAFWRAFLRGTPPIVAFPQRRDAVANDYSAESMYFELDEATSQSLRVFANDNNTTLFIVLFALYGLLLSRYACQDEVVISYPVNMRPEGYGHVFGCFVNLSLLKIAIDRETTFRALVAQLTRQRREAKPHQFYQLNQIINEQAELGLDIEKSYFGVFFGETHLGTSPLVVNGLSVRPLDIPWSEEFDRDLRLLYDADGAATIKLRMDFRCGKYDRALIIRFIDDFKTFSRMLVADRRPLLEGALSETAC
jgi:condensation domain-containing protein